jgi:hemerythrin superfamily protein
MESITRAMILHHKFINDILLEFEKIPEKNSNKLSETFSRFKWNLNKHMFVEEENIFPIANKKNPVEIKILNNLFKDHADIRTIIENLESEMSLGRKPNTMIFRELLFAHEGREVQGFYPLLDKRLSEKDKSAILMKIKDVKLR